MANLLKKEVEKLKKEEEKVVFKIHKFKVRKKLFFSILLSLLVTVIGFSKVESLHELGMHVSSTVVLVTFIVCSLFLFITVIRKNILFFTRQVLYIFAGLFLLFRLITIKDPYSLTDLLFISILVTTISLSIYDIF